MIERTLKRYHVTYYYLTTGMEGIADIQDYGNVTASGPVKAIDIAARRRHVQASEDTIAFVKTCLTAKAIP